LDRVLAGIAAAAPLFPGLKIDTVVIRGTNDDELVSLIEFGRRHGAEVRFIEYMDVGGATHWSMDRVVSRREMLAVIGAHYGEVTPIVEETSAPADRTRCRTGRCSASLVHDDPLPSRPQPLTADGLWYLCLYAPTGTDLRRALRAGASSEELARLLTVTWETRADRGAEERLAGRGRLPLITVDRLRRDPHLEMHTRGG
jgi:cyclic pyranopterin phosphate synthase